MIPNKNGKIKEAFGGKKSVYATLNLTIVRTGRLHTHITSNKNLYVMRYVSSIRLSLKTDIKKKDNKNPSSKDK